MALNATPGVALGLILGWDPLGAVLLGGVTWITSSGVVSKVLSDLGRLGFRETPAVLNLLVIEDLAMAIYLPVVAALIVGGTVTATFVSVAIALATVTVILLAALRYGRRLSDLVAGGSDETFLLTVFGITLLVAGVAQRLEVSGAIGAFLVGLALSGKAEIRANQLISPLRDLFAAMFFLFFSFQIDPADLVVVIVPAIALAFVTVFTKVATGWYAAGRMGVGSEGADAGRNGVDRSRRVLDRDRRTRIEPDRRARARRARCRLRVDHRRGGTPRREVLRPHPDPRSPRPVAPPRSRGLTVGCAGAWHRRDCSADLEDRVLRSGCEQFVVGGVGADTVEELADLPLPAAEVGAQDLGLVGVVDLDERHVFAAPAEAKVAGARMHER